MKWLSVQSIMSEEDRLRRVHYIQHNLIGCFECDLYEIEADKEKEELLKVFSRLIRGY